VADVMTWAEIEASYPDEWVLILEPETGPDLRVRSGVVAYHGKDRDELHRVARALVPRPRRTAVLFLGDPVPPGELVIL
jgi:hypothetical protein